MKNNDELRIHIINVGHGDSILVEFPDSVEGDARKPRFGLVDAGGSEDAVKLKTLEYLKAFIECRLEDATGEYLFEFICLTHPHEDHYLGMMDVLTHFVSGSIPPQQFWDCGFRYNTGKYLAILDFLNNHKNEVEFLRVTSGTEFHYGDVEVMVLAPSIDLRNRYDTYGVEPNNASIVLRITRGDGVAILAGDAHFDSWGKICEEFPREKHLTYPPAGTKPDLRDPTSPGLVLLSQADQLKCNFLKVAHHGSKNGTAYEYLEKLDPSFFVVTCDKDANYKDSWKGRFPHPITRLVIGTQLEKYDVSSRQIPSVTDLAANLNTSVESGTMIVRIPQSGRITSNCVQRFNEGRDDMVDKNALCQAL